MQSAEAVLVYEGSLPRERCSLASYAREAHGQRGSDLEVLSHLHASPHSLGTDRSEYVAWALAGGARRGDQVRERVRTPPG